uniref:DUF148 domain-containing protein n=1 Tax=Steinernema glaseri TaxID=37863 RepID=A0A1I8A2L7_9BILA
MASSALLLVLCFSAAMALDVPSDGVGKKVFDSLPGEIQTFLKNLSVEDGKLLQSLSGELKGKSLDDVIAAVKPKSEELANKLKEMANGLATKIGALPEDGQKFMANLLSSVEGVTDPQALSEAVKKVAASAKNLPKDVQDKITKDFPSLKELLN